MLRFFYVALIFLFLVGPLFAENANIVNVYTFAEEIPDSVLAQFEKETGIKVYCSSYDTNEAMYAKLRATKSSTYDVIEPSSYYVDRMRRHNFLETLDRSQLPEFKHLDPYFLNLNYDPNSVYSIPFVWGVTGIFVNKSYFAPTQVVRWSDLFSKKYKNQLMMLDDPREAFSMALLMLGYSINDKNPHHIQQAYRKLCELMPNIRLFNTDAVESIVIDEDATVGIAWNGDLIRAYPENQQLTFIYPKDGFEIWVDNFAIMKNAPHKTNAYKFLNFLLRPEIAKEISMKIGYSTANLTAKNLMPPEIKNNPMIYPPYSVLARGEFETDIGDSTFALYEKYWEQLKMGV